MWADERTMNIMKEYDAFSQKLHGYIQENQEALIEQLLELVRHKSVSASGEGVEACCAYIVGIMEKIGIETTVHLIKPYPCITGKLGDDPAKKTVLIYAHYDVQPEGDLSKWKSEPFEPVIHDGRIWGRGTADNKGPLMAHLLAVDYLKNHLGSLPVNLKFIFEGCEESNSVGLPEFLAENKELLKADMVYFSDGSKSHSDEPIIALGVKGMLYVELVLTSMVRDVHSQYAPVLPNAAWEMVELLGKLRRDGIVQIPGFYEDIIPATPKENEILNSGPNVDAALRKTYGANPIYDPKVGYYATLNNTPTFNISGISSGFTGDGTATVIPSKAVAKLDMRLVVAQSGKKILENLKAYLHTLGYDNVEVICHGITDPAKTSIDTPYLPVIQRAVNEEFGSSLVYPNRPSTAPDYLWTNILGLPTIQVRWCDFDSDNHAPNEHLKVENYLKGIALTATALTEIGTMPLEEGR